MLNVGDEMTDRVICSCVLKVEVQSLLVAEVVGGAKSTAKKSSLKKLCRLWEEVCELILSSYIYI